MSRWTAVTLAVAAFWCFWQASGRVNVSPFNDEQWRLLGGALAIGAAAFAWRVQRAR